MNETDTTKEAWQRSQIDEPARRQILEELMATGDMAKVSRVLQQLATGLEPGQSRAVVRAPEGYQARDEHEFLTGTARMAAEIADYGLDRIPRVAGAGPFQLLENQAVTDYTPAYGAPVGPIAPDPSMPIGYMQVQHTGQAPQASLGYLDMQARIDRSMPLPMQP